VFAKITGKDASGNTVVRYLAPYLSKYSSSNYSIAVEKNSEGTFSNIVTNNIAGRSSTDSALVSFLVPYTESTGVSIGDRDSQMEMQTAVSPIYHKSACGLEES